MADFDVLGFNYRMTDLQGALGLVQIEKLEGFIAERARWAAWYREAPRRYRVAPPAAGAAAWAARLAGLRGPMSIPRARR